MRKEKLLSSQNHVNYRVTNYLFFFTMFLGNCHIIIRKLQSFFQNVEYQSHITLELEYILCFRFCSSAWDWTQWYLCVKVFVSCSSYCWKWLCSWVCRFTWMWSSGVWGSLLRTKRTKVRSDLHLQSQVTPKNSMAQFALGSWTVLIPEGKHANHLSLRFYTMAHSWYILNIIVYWHLISEQNIVTSNVLSGWSSEEGRKYGFAVISLLM